MVTPHRLVSLANAGHFERLIEEVLENGRPLPLRARLRLTEPESLAGSALGLALQRLVELLRAPDERVRRLLDNLLERQREDGSFGPVAPTCIALGALLAWERAGWSDERLPAAIERSAHALFAAQERSWSERGGAQGLLGDALDSAVALWQLGHERRFREAVRVNDLLDALDACAARSDGACAEVLDMVWTPALAAA